MKAVHSVTAAEGIPLLMLPEWLDAGTCERIRRAMDRGADDPAEIAGAQISKRVDVRRARSVEIDATLLALVESRIDAARLSIERTIRLRLGEREGTGFLRYPPGGFYRPHRDRGEVGGWPAAAKRRITVVLFLNTASGPARPGDFDGGDLALHLDQGAPVNISPVAGLLVAFPSRWLHEVRPVTGGTRDTAVDWFYDPAGMNFP